MPHVVQSRRSLNAISLFFKEDSTEDLSTISRTKRARARARAGVLSPLDHS